VTQQYIDFAYVKEHASFERVIAGYNLKLLGKGAQRAVLCPFHRERKASCKIDVERNIWHCFGCGAKGNILEFAARMEGDAANLRAAALKIAELCGIATAPPREGGGRRDTTPPRQHSQSVEAAEPMRPKRGAVRRCAKPVFASAAEGADGRLGDHSNGNLTKSQLHGAAEAVNPPLAFALKLDPAHPYLAERGLTAELVAEFGLGYCNRGVMAGRVCIPIHNQHGDLVAYAGRWPSEDLPEGEERYKLPVKFQKNRVLFNLHRVDDARHVVLVEGYWSAMRLYALGVPTVALMGSSVSTEQLALLRERDTQCVTLLLDGDGAGRQARERALPGLASSLYVRAPLLPDGQKPDTLPEAELLELVLSPLP
jgi:DNA primase